MFSEITHLQAAVDPIDKAIEQKSVRAAAESLADTHLMVLVAAIGSCVICAREAGFLVGRLRVCT
ncbi:hypothetical protein [Bradyrhizobium zhanjiangense]|uniref:hypothetical protein n=1 Tax=Bradyrhizobium zhanjiangense TaxID=1325107 RepID=UPI001008DB7F|nr:hypothetical protein [Bradyrhizobium zhanjiangense]